MTKPSSRPSVQTRIARLRHKVLAVSDAGAQLQRLARKISQEQRKAVIHIDGKKAAVIISYTEYEQIELLRTQQMKAEVLEQLIALIARHARQASLGHTTPTA
jgi:PHD/YefM family antitoxin component YafN of YafNO toxin-antitoxin module